MHIVDYVLSTALIALHCGTFAVQISHVSHHQYALNRLNPQASIDVRFGNGNLSPFPNRK